MRWMILGLGYTFVVVMGGCSKNSSSDEGRPVTDVVQIPARSLTDQAWTLTELDRRVSPAGAGGRAPDIWFDAVNGRVAGFTGCNRFGGSYTLAGDSLIFGPMIATKMFCQEGDTVERAFLAMLPLVRTYAIKDSTLTLRGESMTLARFRAGAVASE